MIQGALKLLKGVYSNIETSVDAIRTIDCQDINLVKNAEDVFQNIDAMCLCVVSALLGVSLSGVAQAVRSKHSSSPCSNVPTRKMPWCVHTSRTAEACCRLFNSLKETYIAYTIDVSVAEDSLDQLSSLNIGSKSSTELTVSNLIPWDLRMVQRYQLYLPRVCYEYSGIQPPVPLPGMHNLTESSSKELYVHKAYQALLQMALSDCNVYNKLRYVRGLIFHHFCHGGDRECKYDIFEVLRNGRTLDVVPASSLDDLSFDANTCQNEMSFFHRLMTQPLVQSFQSQASKSKPNCSICLRNFNLRCLQSKTLTSLITVVYTARNTPSDSGFKCFSFLLSVVIMVARHLCIDLMSQPCDCCRSIEIFDQMPLFNDYEKPSPKTDSVLSDFHMSNLWSSIEVCVLHCDYLLCCNSTLTSESKDSEGDPELEGTLQFPLSCLNPILFACIHREVVRNCKSRDDVGYFLEKCFDSSGAASCDKSTCKVKDIFLAFVNIAICRDDM